MTLPADGRAIPVTLEQTTGSDAAPGAVLTRAAWLLQFEEAASASEQSCLQGVAEVLGRAADLLSCGWFEYGGNPSSNPEPVYIHRLPLAESALEAVLSAVADTAARKHETIVAATRIVRAIHQTDSANVAAGQTAAPPDSASEPVMVLATQIPVEGSGPAVFAACFRRGRGTSPDSLISLHETAVAAIRVSRVNRDRLESVQELAATAAVIDLATRVENAETFTDACQQLVDRAASHMGCVLVAIGVAANRNRPSRLMAISGDAIKRDDATHTRMLEAAIDEVLLHDAMTIWPPVSRAGRHSLMTHRQVMDAVACGSIIGCPLRTNAGETIGAWLFCGGGELRGDPEHKRFIEAASWRLGTSLNLVRQAQRAMWQRSLLRAWERGTKSPLKTTLAAAGLLLAVMCLPVSYRVQGQCELQPVVRRYVAAPFDGILETAFVEAGDTVTAGQMLARIDDREIQWELAGIDAEKHRAARERDTHLARQDIGASQISRYDVERLETRRRLLSHRSDHLDIRSPIDGLVITGDLQRSEGVPLKTGDKLFEIAPLAQMSVEVAIPESEIRHVQAGQSVDIRLDAWPGETWTGTLERIHPRSELIDNEHVFVGEVVIDNTDGRLRPGMDGDAKVTTRRKLLGWILFHRPFEALVLRMGW